MFLYLVRPESSRIFRRKVYNGNWTEWSAIWSEIIHVISKSNEHAARVRFEITKYGFRPKLHDPKSNYHFIKSILKSHDFMALNFRFSCIVPSRAGLLEIAEAERLQHVCTTMSCDENSFKHNKQTGSSEVRVPCIKVRLSSPKLMMENLPLSCGWGWNVSLSLEKEF